MQSYETGVTLASLALHPEIMYGDTSWQNMQHTLM
jgi:hypothetical protein